MDRLERGEQDPGILTKIQEVEAQIERMNVQAIAEAQRMVNEARQEAQRMSEEQTQKIEQDHASFLEQGLREARQEAEQISEAARRQAGELKERAAGNVEKAIDLVLERVFSHLYPGGRM